MDYIDYYKVLGVDKSADQAAIKKGYKRMARKYHPDVSKEPNAEHKFKEVGEAYEVLKDEEKRASYDTLGANWKDGQNYQPPPGWSGAGGQGAAGGGAGFSDFFDSMFGGGFAQQGGGRPSGFEDAFGQRGYASEPGEDITVQLKVSLEQVLEGKQVTMNLSTGKSLKVKIPKGIREGQKIRLAGQGGEGRGGGAKGALLVEVRYQKHPHFKVEGSDVELELPMAPWEAALGASVAVPTLTGRIQLKIPAGSSTGKRLRLKGRGLPAKVPGDFYVKVVVENPVPETDAQKEAFEALKAQFENFDPRKNLP